MAEECAHVLPDNKLYKKTITVLDRITDSHNRTLYAVRKVDNSERCFLCNDVYHYTRSYGERHLISSKPGEDTDTLIPNLHPLRLEQSENPTFTVELIHNQLGEAYHVFICRLLLAQDKSNIKIRIIFSDKNPNDLPKSQVESDREELRQLFMWYKLNPRPKGTEIVDGKLSKEQTSRIIADVFEKSNTCAPTTEATNQPGIFQQLASQLDSDIWPEELAKKKAERVVIGQYYTPAWAAKYWLNRYLTLTRDKQRVSKLPNTKLVKRLAVIHVRRAGSGGAATSAGRDMDDANLVFVAASIGRANRVAGDANQKLFSHIILYGDFDYSGGCRLQELVQWAYSRGYETNKSITKCVMEDWKKEMSEKNEKKGARNTSGADEDAEHSVRIMFITRPWKKAPVLQNIDEEINDLWTEFCSCESDYLPKHVKILAIWSALRERYGSKVCIIGHRSGFIEGAGFIGIPIFYLMNERMDVPKQVPYASTAKSAPSQNAPKVKGKPQKESWRPGELLWQRVQSPEDDRLRLLSSVMNTFIPVEALENKAQPIEPDQAKGETSKSSRTNQHKGSSKTSNAKGEAPGTAEKESSKNNKKQDTTNNDPVIFRVESGYENELAAALFMYMCCELEPGPDPATAFPHQPSFPHQPGASRRDDPGWTARVDMMNDKCSDHEHALGHCPDKQHNEGQETYQTGQEWLRRRYEYAIAVLGEDDQSKQKKAKAKTHKPRLSVWSGIKAGKWISVPREANKVTYPSVDAFELSGEYEGVDADQERYMGSGVLDDTSERVTTEMTEAFAELAMASEREGF